MKREDFFVVRKRLGYTQRQFGELLRFKWPQVRVSEIERGHVPISPRVEELVKFIFEKDGKTPKLKMPVASMRAKRGKRG